MSRDRPEGMWSEDLTSLHLWLGKITDSKVVSRSVFFFKDLTVYFSICFMCVCVHVHEQMRIHECVYMYVHVVDNLWKTILSYYHVSVRDWTCAVRLYLLIHPPRSALWSSAPNGRQTAPQSVTFISRNVSTGFSPNTTIKYLSWKMAYNNWPVILPSVLY